MIKRILTAVAFTVIAVLVSSCNKAEVIASNDSAGKEDVNEGSVSESGWTLECDFSFTGSSSYQIASKAVKTEWAKDDVVFIFINGIEGKFLKLTNTGSGWKTEDVGGIVNTLSAATVTLNAIHVPYADNAVVPAYSGDKWTINIGDVYFAYATGVSGIQVLVNEETKTKRLKGTIELTRQADYVQVYFDKDERQTGIENLKIYCNQLDRYTTVTMDASGNFQYSGKDESEMVWFNAHELEADGNSGIAIYGTLKQGRSETSLFMVNDSPIIYDFRTSQLTQAKAYKVSYNAAAKEAGKKWVRWTRSLPYEYEINDAGGKVRFTPGNLQVSQVSYPHWKYADAQYSVLGTLNKNISSEFNTAAHYWDLFQWGASGLCNSSCTVIYTPAFQINYPVVPLTPAAFAPDDLCGYRGDLIGERTNIPYPSSGSVAFYRRYLDRENHGIVKQSAFMYTTGGTVYDDQVHHAYLPADGDDWGSNNVEFCKANVARTLTVGEWEHISAKYPHKLTTVCNVQGWAIAPEGYTIESNYDAASFAQAEKDGLVFFPRAGRRSVNDYILSDEDSKVEEGYRYWTSSLTNELVDEICTLPASVSLYPKASNPELYPDKIVPRADFGAWGTAVRLAVDVFHE